MKKFIFSFILALCISGLTYFGLQNNGNEIFTTINTYNEKAHSIKPVLWLEISLSTKNYINANIHDTVINGTITFFATWIILAFILGVKPFLSDMKAFFPIKA